MIVFRHTFIVVNQSLFSILSITQLVRVCLLYTSETMSFLGESDIKLSAMKRSLLVQSSKSPLEVLFLRDDDIAQSVATGVADIGIVGQNEFVEKNEDAEIIKRLGFSKCRLSLAMPKDIRCV